MRVVQALGVVCYELRVELNRSKGLRDPEKDFQAMTNLLPWGAGRSSKTLRGFEQGESNPTHLDDLIVGYSMASGVSISEIWRRAIERAEAAAKRMAAEDAAAAKKMARVTEQALEERPRGRRNETSKPKNPAGSRPPRTAPH